MRPFPVMGMRIVKTSISVMVCLLLGRWLNQPPPIYACIAAVVVMRESVELSRKQGAARVISTVVGCLLGIAIMLVNVENGYLHILITGAGCALTIYFCVLIKHPEAAALSGIIFLSLAISHPDDKYVFALTRLVETVAGIAVSIGVNMLLKGRPAEAQGDSGKDDEM